MRNIVIQEASECEYDDPIINHYKDDHKYAFVQVEPSDQDFYTALNQEFGSNSKNLYNSTDGLNRAPKTYQRATGSGEYEIDQHILCYKPESEILGFFCKKDEDLEQIKRFIEQRYSETEITDMVSSSSMSAGF